MMERPDIERIRETYTDDFNGMAIDGSVIHLCDHALALKARNALLESQITKKQELIEELEQTIAALEE